MTEPMTNNGPFPWNQVTTILGTVMGATQPGPYSAPLPELSQPVTSNRWREICAEFKERVDRAVSRWTETAELPTDPTFRFMFFLRVMTAHRVTRLLRCDVLFPFPAGKTVLEVTRSLLLEWWDAHGIEAAFTANQK